MNVDDRIRAAFRAEEIPPPPPGVVSPEDALAMEQQPRGSEMPTPEPEVGLFDQVKNTVTSAYDDYLKLGEKTRQGMPEGANNLLTATMQEYLGAVQGTSPVLRGIGEKPGSYNRPMVGTVVPARVAEYLPPGAENDEFVVVSEGGVVRRVNEFEDGNHVMLRDEDAPGKPLMLFQRTPDTDETAGSFGRLLGLGMAGDVTVAGGQKLAQAAMSFGRGRVGSPGTLAAGGVTDTTELRDNVDEGLNRLAQVGQVDNVKRRTLADLHERIPPETRVAKDHIPGETMQPVSGGRFSDLDLNAPGAGFTGTQGDLDRLWRESVSESGAVAGKTVARLGMSPRQLEFWDDALRLSARGRYWYEVSTESFKDLLPDLSPDELKKFISVVAATSPVANPFQNMQRTVAAFSAYLRGVPIDSDLVIPRAVRDALETGDLEGLKTGSFGGTMQFIDGLTDVAPLSTNDRQVASAFGVSGDDIAGNPELYEVLSRFYTKMRDDLNAKLPPGAEPYETWQLQALGWIQERTLSGNPFNDDYLDALTKIDPSASIDRKSVLQLLQEGGVNVPGGIITRDVLMDPRVTDILSPTTPPFREAPIATIEVNTVQTMAGARASDLLQKAVEQGDDVAVSEFNKMTTGALYKASRGTTSPFSPMISAVIGKKIKASRIEVPTSDRPFDVAGTYKGQMSPNIRVPLQGLSNDDINVVMAGMAKAWKQEGVPATRFTTTTMEAPPVEGSIRTYSVFIQTTDDVAGDTWLKFADALPEVNEISVRRVPNGYVLNVHPDYEKRVGPATDAVENAIDALGYPADKVDIVPSDVVDFSYETLDGADDTINAWKQRIRKNAIETITAKSGLDADAAGRFFDGDNGAIQKIPSGRRKQAERIRTLGQRRVSDFNKAVEQAQGLGGSLAEGQRKWAEKFGPRLEGTTKPELVKSTPAVERFLANPQGRPMPVTERP